MTNPAVSAEIPSIFIKSFAVPVLTFATPLEAPLTVIVTAPVAFEPSKVTRLVELPVMVLVPISKPPEPRNIISFIYTGNICGTFQGYFA